MALDTRLKKLEGKLDSRKRTLLWLEQAKSAGGYVGYWKETLRRPFFPHDWMDDEAFFLYLLINDVNVYVLQNAQSNSECLWFAAGMIRQFITAHKLTARDSQILNEWRTHYGRMLAETLAFKAATEVFTTFYCEEHDILFPDTRAELDDAAAKLREIADIFNGLASELGVAPLEVEGFSEGHPAVDEKVEQFVRAARAEVLANAGAVTAGVQQLCPELTNPSVAGRH